MKKIVVFTLGVLLFIPSVAMSVKSAKIERDQFGGYSETQRDYKKRMYYRDENKKKPGYYEGTYHNQSPEFKQGEYQFIESGSKAKHKKKRK